MVIILHGRPRHVISWQRKSKKGIYGHHFTWTTQTCDFLEEEVKKGHYGHHFTWTTPTCDLPLQVKITIS